jgi:hypothetical protein
MPQTLAQTFKGSILFESLIFFSYFIQQMGKRGFEGRNGCDDIGNTLKKNSADEY